MFVPCQKTSTPRHSVPYFVNSVVNLTTENSEKAQRARREKNELAVDVGYYALYFAKNSPLTKSSNLRFDNAGLCLS